MAEGCAEVMPTAARPRSALLPAVLVALGGAAAAPALETPRPPARVWYVDNTSPEGGDGSLVAPFSSLERAERASDVGDTVYVFLGDGTARGLDEGIRLKPRQLLVGSGVALAADGEEILPAGDPPLLTAPRGAVVELAELSSVAGVAIAGGGGGAEAGIRARGARAVSVRDVRIEGGSGLTVGLELQDVQGAAVSGLAVAGARRHAVLVERSGGVAIRDSRVDHGGEAGAAVALRDPAGHVELAVLDVHPAAGVGVGVDARAGTGTVAMERVALRGPAASGVAATGIEVLAAGTAALEVGATRTVLSGLGSHGIVARAAGGARLGLRVAGTGSLGETHPTEAVAVHASERAEVRLEVLGNDLLAGELALFVTAAGEARVAAEVSDNAVPSIPRGRGVAVVLGDRAEASVRLLRNRLAGHRGEAVYALAGAASRLALELRDNEVAAAPASSADPLPALLLQARDEARLCLALAGNRVGAGTGGGPPMALRQAGAAVVALAGHEPALAGGPATWLAASNELAPAGVILDGALGSPAGLLCPSPTPEPPLAAR